MQHSVPCNVMLGRTLPGLWPFTKVLKTCGKFSRLPCLIPGSARPILDSPADFFILGRETGGRLISQSNTCWSAEGAIHRQTGGVGVDPKDNNGQVHFWRDCVAERWWLTRMIGRAFNQQLLLFLGLALALIFLSDDRNGNQRCRQSILDFLRTYHRSASISGSTEKESR